MLSDDILLRALDAAPDALLIVDGDGVITYANPMAERMFGYPVAELVGGSVERLVPDDVRSSHRRLRDDYAHAPRTRAMGSGLDLRGRHRSGIEFPVEISLSPLRSHGADFFIAAVRDVTERRRLAEELMHANEELALAEDRERIARDLHDTVIQRLFAVGLSLQGVQVTANDPAVSTRVERAIDEIDGTIRDIRSAIFSLHTRRLPTAGPREEVLATAREAARALGFEPSVHFDGLVDTNMPEAVFAQLMPTLREALSNVTRHANASKASVHLTLDDAEVRLQVIDNGVGYSPGDRGGLGVANIEERAQSLGGQGSVTRGPGGGTIVDWRVPLR